MVINPTHVLNHAILFGYLATALTIATPKTNWFQAGHRNCKVQFYGQPWLHMISKS